MTSSPDFPPALPCAVKLGFAGSRRLLEQAPGDGTELALIQAYLTEQLKGLPQILHLSKAHFLCGISQIAVGADTLFTRACRDLHYPQWIVLPQPREEFLNAVGSNHMHDFTEEERNEARSLLESPHVIHEQVVSNAPDRRSRFEDANLEIVRLSDVVVCLLRADSQRKPGGTEHLLNLAKKRGRPTLEIRVGRKDGKLDFVPTWYNQKEYVPPQLPTELRGVPAPTGDPLPSGADYRDALKPFVSSEASGRRKLFRYAALLIILTHLFATLLATAVLALHGGHASAPAAAGSEAHEVAATHPAAHAAPLWIPGLLALELVLLGVGFGVHQYLHHFHTAETWALVRLVAEIIRSVKAMSRLHLDLHYLFWLSLPARLQPLLHTLNILHLRSTRPARGQDWEPLRDSYVEDRLNAPWPKGQIAYYAKALAEDQRLLRVGTAMFVVCSVLAMLATGVKLFVSESGSASEATPWLPPLLGVLAIVFPILAVAGLSFTASMDSAARSHTFAETLEFLKEQEPLLRQTESPREFATLLQETESRLLGEVTSWYSRRSFTSVT
ncbi:MAG TPA: hypothetical protein VH575_20855 [Gemmataceae bacterium]